MNCRWTRACTLQVLLTEGRGGGGGNGAHEKTGWVSILLLKDIYRLATHLKTIEWKSAVLVQLQM